MCSGKIKALNDYIKIMTKEKNAALDKLRKYHEESKYTVKDQIVSKNSRVCFVFSCPGREEMINKKLCAGQTGNNLNSLLSILNKKDKELFPSTSKNDYDILNATPVVHFMDLDNTTEGTKEEIERYSSRIKDYLKKRKQPLDLVIFCGNKSAILEPLFKGKAKKVIEINHLGFQSLNQIKKDVNNEPINEINYPIPSKRTSVRLEKIADDIMRN